MNDTNLSERGQVLIIMVLGFVVLLGFTALAIDGGMLYSDRRYAQNASDASSLAGGGAAALSLENNNINYENWEDCKNDKISTVLAAAEFAAVSRAGDNGFSIDYILDDYHGVKAVCGEDNNSFWTDKYIDVTTLISSTTPTSFAHFVFNGPLQNRVEAITRIRPPSPVANGNAIVALRTDCPNSSTGGVHFDGNSEVTVTGGGIYSNACLEAGGTISVTVVGGSGITCSGDNCYTANGSPTVNPPPQEGAVPLPSRMFQVLDLEEDCKMVPLIGGHNGGGTIVPGQYTNIRLTSAVAVLKMNPGLYCLSGEFKVTGGIITGTEVTIYIRKNGGDFATSGSAQINLTAPDGGNCGDPCDDHYAIPGLLIYMAEGNTGEVSLLGNSDSFYLGLVYAPSGTIEAGGGSSEMSEINAQLVADTVFVHGTTEVFVNFDDEVNFKIPALLELFK